MPHIEKIAKNFIRKLNDFTNNKYDIRITWKTKKVKTLFKLKDPNPHPSTVIYEGRCIFGSNYIVETNRNTHTRWTEHEDIRKDLVPVKHLKQNENRSFQWRILSYAPKNFRQRKNLEATYIALNKPNLDK